MTAQTSQTLPAMPTPSWMPGVEALRGIAALMVVAHHAWSLSDRVAFPGSFVFEGFGGLGVNLFFLLSGFLLADQFWRTKRPRQIRIFWIRRFFRLAPAYYAAVALLFLFFAEHALVFSRQGVIQVAANLTFTHYLFPNTASSLNVDGALWTLTIEFFLYLTLPLMAIPFGKRPLPTFVILIAIGIAWRLYLALAGDQARELYFPSGGPDQAVQSLYLARQFLGVIPIFAVGIGLKYLVISGRLSRVLSHLPQFSRTATIAVALLPAIGMSLFVERSADYRNWIWFTFYDYAVALLLVPALMLATRPYRVVPSRIDRAASWVGDRSYSLYLWHFPIILAVYGRGPFLYPPEGTNPVPRVLAVLVLALLFAHVSYVAIERPGIALGRRIVDRIAVPRRSSQS